MTDRTADEIAATVRSSVRNTTPVHVGIAAETIAAMECGLGYFLAQAIRHLVAAEPNWRFTIVASSSYPSLRILERELNVQVRYWDRSRVHQAVAGLWQRVWSDLDGKQVTYRLANSAPTGWLRYQLGNAREFWARLPDIDVIWAPHYAIGAPHLALDRTLADVGVPVLLTLHDVQPVEFPNDWNPATLKRFWHGLAPFARRADHVITHSQYQRCMITKHLGVAPDRISVIPVPPLIDATALTSAPVSTSCGDDPAASIAEPFFFYPGSNTFTHKNHIRLLLAWSKLRQCLGSQCPMLVCTARDPYWAPIQSLIESLDLQERVMFTGTVETASLASLYRRCAAVVVPTLHEGGGSGPVAEACLVGKPVACSRIPPIEEQLHAYGVPDVVFFDPRSVESIAEAVTTILSHYEEWVDNAQQNRAILSERSIAMWTAWAEFYAKRLRVLANGSRRSE